MRHRGSDRVGYWYKSWLNRNLVDHGSSMQSLLHQPRPKPCRLLSFSSVPLILGRYSFPKNCRCSSIDMYLKMSKSESRVIAPSRVVKVPPSTLTFPPRSTNHWISGARVLSNSVRYIVTFDGWTPWSIRYLREMESMPGDAPRTKLWPARMAAEMGCS